MSSQGRTRRGQPTGSGRGGAALAPDPASTLDVSRKLARRIVTMTDEEMCVPLTFTSEVDWLTRSLSRGELVRLAGHLSLTLRSFALHLDPDTRREVLDAVAARDAAALAVVSGAGA